MHALEIDLGMWGALGVGVQYHSRIGLGLEQICSVEPGIMGLGLGFGLALELGLGVSVGVSVGVRSGYEFSHACYDGCN